MMSKTLIVVLAYTLFCHSNAQSQSAKKWKLFKALKQFELDDAAQDAYKSITLKGKTMVFVPYFVIYKFQLLDILLKNVDTGSITWKYDSIGPAAEYWVMNLKAVPKKSVAIIHKKDGKDEKTSSVFIYFSASSDEERQRELNRKLIALIRAY